MHPLHRWLLLSWNVTSAPKDDEVMLAVAASRLLIFENWEQRLPDYVLRYFGISDCQECRSKFGP